MKRTPLRCGLSWIFRAGTTWDPIEGQAGIEGRRPYLVVAERFNPRVPRGTRQTDCNLPALKRLERRFRER